MRSIFDCRYLQSARMQLLPRSTGNADGPRGTLSRRLTLAGTVTLLAVPLLLTSMVSISLSRVAPGQAFLSRGLLLTGSATLLHADEPTATTTTPAESPAPTTPTTPAPTTAPSTTPTTDAVTGLSEQDAVALGSDAFVKQYTAKSTDTTTTGVATALNVFDQFQRDINRQATLPLTKKQQHAIGDLREALRCAIDGYIASNEAIDQGGTIYAMIRARAAVDREVTLAQVIGALTTPAKDRKGRQLAERNFVALQATISNLPTPDLATPRMWKARFKKAHATLLTCVPKLRRVLHQLPDKGVEITVHYLQHEITPTGADLTATP